MSDKMVKPRMPGLIDSPMPSRKADGECRAERPNANRKNTGNPPSRLSRALRQKAEPALLVELKARKQRGSVGQLQVPFTHLGKHVAEIGGDWHVATLK